MFNCCDRSKPPETDPSGVGMNNDSSIQVSSPFRKEYPNGRPRKQITVWGESYLTLLNIQRALGGSRAEHVQKALIAYCKAKGITWLRRQDIPINLLPTKLPTKKRQAAAAMNEAKRLAK